MTFQYLIDRTTAVFATLDCQPISMPGKFAKAERLEQEGALTIANHFFQVAQFGQLRIAHTYAPKINILAVFFFPGHRYQLPVYSMEFVVLGQMPIIALMDMKCLLQPMSISNHVVDLMASAHSGLLEYGQAMRLPPWFDECRSGHEIYCKPREIAEYAALGEIHLKLVDGLATLFQQAGLYDEEHAALHKAQLESYKKHHSINSPGTRLMNRSFGADWTSQYLADYLFF
jgi:Ferredoxin-dependent bilin reductase